MNPCKMSTEISNYLPLSGVNWVLRGGNFRLRAFETRGLLHGFGEEEKVP